MVAPDLLAIASHCIVLGCLYILAFPMRFAHFSGIFELRTLLLLESLRVLAVAPLLHRVVEAVVFLAAGHYALSVIGRRPHSDWKL